jgi:hypothetical protein
MKTKKQIFARANAGIKLIKQAMEAAENHPESLLIQEEIAEDLDDMLKKVR